MPINLDRDRYMFPRPQVPLLLLFMLIHFAQDATAETYYVNNQSGNDANRGTASASAIPVTRFRLPIPERHTGNRLYCESWAVR